MKGVKSQSPLIFALARIENLMHQVTFDPARMEGKIITNTSVVRHEDLETILDIFSDTISSGLAVCPIIKVEDLGEFIQIHTAAA